MNDTEYQADTYVMTAMPDRVPTVAEARGPWLLNRYAARVINAGPGKRACVTPADCLAYAQWYAAWLLWSAQQFLKELWLSIPGPLWVKLIICAILLACLAIPGPFDEMFIIALIKAGHKYRTRRALSAS